VSGVRKDYLGLRPLRIERLVVAAGEFVAVAGLDAAAGEVLTHLVTGASLPDQGEVRLFGRSTASVSSADDWVRWLDRIGLVSERAVSLGALTVEQNLAMAFTLEIDPVPEAIRARIAALASEVGIAPAALSGAMGEATPELSARARLARAAALEPWLLLLEHPTASLPRAVVPALAKTLGAMSRKRQVAVLAVSGDAEIHRVADRVLDLQAATGRLRERFRLSRWLRD
jgi:ATP-binding cassette subfamily C protein CydCD